MKVKELIKELKKMDGEWDVVIGEDKGVKQDIECRVNYRHACVIKLREKGNK